MKNKLNQPDVEMTTTITGESINLNVTIPSKQFTDIFATQTTIQEYKHTLEEIKQDWEALGYVCEEGASHLVLRYKDTNNMIHIWEDHTYRADDWLTFQEHQLLSRTFKALGWE